MFYLHAWLTTLLCSIVGVELCLKVGVFPLIFKIGRSKQNVIVKLSKFSLKMEGC